MRELITDILKGALPGFGIELDSAQLEKLERYAALLKEWNEKMNLTAITDDEGIALKHFLDSLTVLAACEVPEGARVVDVGTGAGFPGVVLKIARPDIELTLIDSLGKRVTFLEALTAELGMKAKCLHLRAEDAGHVGELREHFDLVTARAVAELRVLSEYCLPLAKTGGFFIAMKGPEMEAELADAKNAIKTLGGGKAECRRFELEGAGRRTVITVKKLTPAPKQYPRPAAKIAKRPL